MTHPVTQAYFYTHRWRCTSFMHCTEGFHPESFENSIKKRRKNNNSDPGNGDLSVNVWRESLGPPVPPVCDSTWPVAPSLIKC